MSQPTQRPVKNRTTIELNQRIERKLCVYASAAGAACAGMAMSSRPAEAEIVFTPAHTAINSRHTLALDLNHDGIKDFTISNGVFSSTDISGRTLRALPAGSNKVAGLKAFVNTLYAYALNPGSVIGPKLQFVGKIMAASGTEYGSIGRWKNVTNRYLGLEFHINGQVHFGWARFTVTSGTGKITAILTGYAYETIPNRPIVAGKSSGTADVSQVPDAKPNAASGPTMLGMLAGGAPALSVWRHWAETAGAGDSPN
jgi:hypothetical protein